MLSITDDRKSDRMWNIHCYAKLPTYQIQYSISYWSSFFVNDFHGDFKFQCGPQAVISGMGSIYSAYHKDRRYNFSCTHLRYYKKIQCKWTEWLNKFNAPMSYHVPTNSFIGGFESGRDSIIRYVLSVYSYYLLQSRTKTFEKKNS